MVDIHIVLHKLGLNAKLKGYHFLATAVRLVLKDQTFLFRLSKDLYPQVAAYHKTSAACVDRNLRTALQIIWDRGNRAFLNEMAGYPLFYRPTSGELIDLLACYCRSKGGLYHNG